MTDIDEKKMELFVVFQEKLSVKIHDQGFREEFLAPLLYSGITEQALNTIINNIVHDNELQEILNSLNGLDVKQDLKLLLKKIIERFSKFDNKPNDDYIG